MKRNGTVIIIVLMHYISLCGQTIYMDPVVSAATIAQSESLKKEQQNTNNILNQIKVAETAVNQQLAVANELHQKVYKGLSEVSGLVNDAFTVKQIYENCNNIINKSAEITTFASKNPQFAVFAYKEVSEFKRRVLLLSADVSSTLTGGQFNLMNAGQRRALLNDVRVQTSLLSSQAWMILHSMKQAKNIGFWRAINPFQSWYNRDAIIARDIINRSRFVF